jgi:membrane protein implicated in regulation of membrane protease activity
MIDGIDHGWLWLIGGVVLLIAEVIAPGFFLLFIGAAAIATGVFSLLFGLGTVLPLALFALYALLAVLIGRRF